MAGSRRNLDGNPAGIPARFWPPRFFFPAGISPGSRQDSRREVKFPVAKISTGSFFESRQDSRREVKIPAVKISPGSCRESCQDSRQEAKIPAAKISARSCREAHQDSRREAIILAVKISPESYRNLAKFLAEKQIHGGKNLGAILPGISPRLATGSEILGSRFTAGISSRISFGSSPMFTDGDKIKYKQKQQSSSYFSEGNTVSFPERCSV